MDDLLMEALTATCGECGSSSEVTWCPAYGAWLCGTHRANRNDAELRVKLGDRDEMQAAAGGQT